MNENKLTWEQLRDLLMQYNKIHNEAGYLYTFKPLYAVAVFSADNWPDKDYPLESRSYKFSCDNKAFHSYCGGYSCFASSLDGSTRGPYKVRLEGGLLLSSLIHL